LLDSAYLGIILIGLTHGLNPGHGWPVAFLYSTLKNKPLLYGFVSSLVISSFHFVSSISVVLVYTLVSSYFDLSTQLLKYVSAIMLFALAILFYREDVQDELEAQHEHLHESLGGVSHNHEHQHLDNTLHTHVHEHSKSLKFSLWGIAAFALVLGFAHEEEFALLAFAIGGINPYVLMIVYATSVTLALVGVTMICVKAYKAFLPRIRRYQKYLSKIAAIILGMMGVAFLFGLV
jgi:nickel/cobalt transporter (NicO) family protein